MDFNGIEELMGSLKQATLIELSESGYIGQMIKDILIEVIKDVVYDGYDPSWYRDDTAEPCRRRREDGGLLDKENIKLMESYLNDTIVVNVTNEAKGRFDNERLDDIIISGNGYTWKESRIYQDKIPRDFIKETQNILDNTGVINNLLKARLKERYGFDVE